ncbi:MAG TPA: Ig-like domain-containing protein [Steroidobacteraceae bacterium]|nr:Ig-like domain-containing protein [Steroidobacteraceae bacterium]
MQIDRFSSWAALLLLGCVTGCAGNGMGLDQNGQPISPGGGTGGPITADFQSIQDNVFTPICSQCHIGAGAPQGLQLDAAHSYNLLVGVPSAEQPNLLRVKPGDPDNSYMVHKIEGVSGITGGRMPLGETPLPQATIDAIRQWITNGAPNTPPATAAAFAVQTTAPLDQSIVNAPLPRILVTFSQDVDASLVNDSTLTLERLGGGATGVVRSALPAAASTLAPNNPAVVMITPATALEQGVYRVTVRGTGGGALANMSATTLGADTSFEFTVVPAQ